MNYTKKVSILGCGWVGNTLKESLEVVGYSVNCLSRNFESNVQKDYYAVDVLIIAIPPSAKEYLDVLKMTINALANQDRTQIIFLSSTSYYKGRKMVVDAEVLVQKLVGDIVILRLGGLMGYDRIAGKYTSGKVLSCNSRTNYVHRDDVIGIIEDIIAKDVSNELFDVVAPNQSTKKDIFAQNARMFGFYDTEFLDGLDTGKVITPAKLCQVLGYTFKKEDVREFWK